MSLTVNRTLLKTFFFRLKLVNVAFTTAIHELQAVAEFVGSKYHRASNSLHGPASANWLHIFVSQQHLSIYRSKKSRL